jgi:hypothetical protein
MNTAKRICKGLLISLVFFYGMFLCFGGWIGLPSPYNFLSIIPGVLFISYELGGEFA